MLSTNSTHSIGVNVEQGDTGFPCPTCLSNPAVTKGKTWVSQNALNGANRPLSQWFNYSIGHSLWQTMLRISNHSMCFSIKKKAHPKPHRASHTLPDQWCHRTVFCLFGFWVFKPSQFNKNWPKFEGLFYTFFLSFSQPACLSPCLNFLLFI